MSVSSTGVEVTDTSSTSGAALVFTVSETSDGTLSFSPFFASTCTRYSESGISPVMVVVVPVPSCGQNSESVQEPDARRS